MGFEGYRLYSEFFEVSFVKYVGVYVVRWDLYLYWNLLLGDVVRCFIVSILFFFIL